MELGHNIGHGQWDWMNDPEIHSTTWEWDMAGLSSQWRYSHNYRHHMFTNVVGVDDDLGYGVLRVTRDQQWKPSNLLQPLRHLLLASRLNGASRCTVCTPNKTARILTSKKSAHTQLCAAKSLARRVKITCSSPRSPVDVGGGSFSGTRSPTCCETCGRTR